MRFVLTPAEAAELDRATQERGISDVLITFTHERTSAVAFAVAVSG